MSVFIKRAAIGSALAAMMALVPAVPAAAAEPTIPCAEGYVCIALLKGTIISVPEGESYSFKVDVTMAGIANQTKTSYCVKGSPNFGLAAGVEIVRTQPVSAFAPGRVCLT